MLPVVQEHFPPDFRTVADMLREKIASCDAVICLVGKYFGLEPQNREPGQPRRSYTQLEYDVARELAAGLLGIKVYVFICADDAEYDPPRERDNEDQEKRSLQDAFRAQIKSTDNLRESYSAKSTLRERVALIDLPIRLHPRNLPYVSLGPLFKGRNRVLSELHEVLSDKSNRATCPIQACVLIGLGGIGKTRLAVEYAWRHLDQHTGSLYVSADSRENVHRGLAGLSAPHILNLPEYSQKDEEVQAAAVVRWLGDHPGWLLICDNADSPEAAYEIETLRTRLSHGRLLITSRFAEWPDSLARVGIDTLDRAACAAFLVERTQERRRPLPKDDALANDLGDLLGGLPLALEQAGAFISYRRCSLADYIHQWQSEDGRMQQWSDPRPTNYPHSVAVTWNVTVQRLPPESRAILRLVSWLSPDPIPWSLFTGEQAGILFDRSLHFAITNFFRRMLRAARSVPHKRLRQRSEREPAFFGETPAGIGLAALSAYSMIKLQPQTEPFAVHPLVQEITRLRLSHRSRRTWLKLAIVLVHYVAPRDPADATTWASWDALTPHVIACIRHGIAFNIGRPLPRLINDLAVLLYAKALYPEAEALMRDALLIEERIWGRGHPRVAIRLNNLGRMLTETNQLDEAEPLLRRAVAIDEHRYGPSHPELASKLNNLGLLLFTTNRLEEAEELFQRALDIDERSFGPIHRTIARDLSNLAEILKRTGRLGEAEPLMRRALAIEEATSPQDHPNVGRALNNLSLLLLDTNRLSEAEPLLRRAVAIDEKVYGPVHPSFATALSNLACLLKESNRVDEAEQLMRRALGIFESAFGPDHPTVARTLGSLGGFLANSGNFAEAERLLRRATVIVERVGGSSHASLGTILNNLAHVLGSTGRVGQAEPLILRALKIDEQILGDSHPDVARDLTVYSGVLEATGRADEADHAIRRSLDIVEKTYGQDHPEVAIRLALLAGLFQRRGRPEEADAFLRRAIRIRQRFGESTGYEHPHMKATIVAYEGLLRAMGFSKDEVARKIAELLNSK
jgi:tetratricopeptide (TPR) repeat protein